MAAAARASCSNRRRRSGSAEVHGGQDLERDVATEPRVVGEINLAHSAAAQQVQDFVGAEQRAGGQGHRGVQCADYTSMT